MALPATTEATSLPTTEDELPLSAEYLLTLTQAEAPNEVFNGGTATLRRWVVVLDQIRGGYPLTVAAAEAGVAYRTAKEWLEKGRAGQYPYDVLVEAIEMAQASAEKRHLGNIFHAAFKQKNWTASAWYLERTRPESYSRRHHIKNDDKRPKEFTLIIDQSGKIADRIESMEQEATEVESRVVADS